MLPFSPCAQLLEKSYTPSPPLFSLGTLSQMVPCAFAVELFSENNSHCLTIYISRVVAEEILLFPICLLGVFQACLVFSKPSPFPLKTGS